jgi:Family of unknown function (DUF6958)
MWHVKTVKLDLEARGQLKRVPKSGPQHVNYFEENRYETMSLRAFLATLAPHCIELCAVR